MKKLLFWGCLLLAVLLLSAASAEPGISFSPENPRMGDYVDVTVTPGREGAQSISWSLSTKAGTVFDGKGTDHFSASFRPRQEAQYTLTVTVSYGKNDTETASVVIPVSGTAPVQEGESVVYSQKDGWWKDKMYSAKHNRSLQKAGCAIFALSHALQRHLGLSGEEVLPDALGTAYSSCYQEGVGTSNEILLRRAGDRFGFASEDDKIASASEIATCLRLGNAFSFSIVNGHVAYADALSEDGTKVHVVDSAPGATYERIKKGSVYVMTEDGGFYEAKTPADIPGIRWFFETGEYGGAEYWLDLDYCARRGMYPIRSPWLTLETEDGSVSVAPEYAGVVFSGVKLDDESVLVPTRNLSWAYSGTDSPKIARVTKRNTALTDGNGKKISGFKALQTGTLVMVLSVENKQLYVCYKGAFGYIQKSNAELLDVSAEDLPSGLISVNGKTTGTAEVNIRLDTSGKKSEYTWVVGTPVTLLEEKGGYYLAEGNGLRGWVKKEYVETGASGVR